MSDALLRIREQLWTQNGPIVIYNKSHSGSRLVAKLADAAGIFMGAHQNDSNDSLDLNRLVHHLIVKHYPYYEALLNGADEADSYLPHLIATVFRSHLEGFTPAEAKLWGWKLGETSYTVPVINYLFPNARFIHVLRDGRDVAFSDHHAPNTAFRKKVYFNTDQIESWRGLKLTQWAYLRRSHIFNAKHWVNSVQVGRAFGTMLGDRYMELRYEELCENFEGTALEILQFMGIAQGAASEAITQLLPTVYKSALHKHLSQKRHKLEEVLEVAQPLLVTLGYIDPRESASR